MGLPVYNGGEYLRETLESVRAQTFKDWELIISNNGSTDGTMEIIQEYAACDERIQYRVHPKNVGAHRNYNSIVPHATGQYFKWLAHDDLMAPTFVERCVDILDARPEVVLVFAATDRIDERSNKISELRSTMSYESDSAYERLRAYVGDRMKAPQIFGVMRRTTLLETGLLRSHGASDFTFLEEMAMRGRFAYVDEPLFFYRFHTQRHSASSAVEQVQYYNPDQKAPMMSEWGQLGGLLNAIRRVPMHPWDKVRSVAFAGWWAFRHGNELLDDLIVRGRYETGKLKAKKRADTTG
ncbi:MAG TPA: glycosyltransferase family A protein [Acidimicrobiia bacterium]|jgi:glycosyltransferase involved in cell wall biosynthesis|nr:glycosyltransferase family A protein [Acidimicrobiia bacterium]